MRSIGSKLIFGATVILASGVFAYFVSTDPFDWSQVWKSFSGQFGGEWSFPIDTIMGGVTVIAMWFAAGGTGLWFIRRINGDRAFDSLWQWLAIGLLVGWVFLGTAIFLIGIAGYANRAALGMLLIGMAAWGIQGWTGLYRASLAEFVGSDREDSEDSGEDTAEDAGHSEREAPGPAPTRNPIGGWALGLMMLLYLIAVPYALTPSVESDALRYHLAAPEAYLAAGKIEYLPHQAFSNFPFLIEMLFMMAMALQGSEAARAIHLTFLETSAVLTGLLTYLLIRLGSGRFGKTSGAVPETMATVAGISLAAIPTATILACWAFVDIATMAYFLAVVYLGALTLVKPRPPHPWLLGVVAAGAIGTKYLMVPLAGAIAFLLAVAVLLGRDARGRKRRWGGAFVAEALLVASLASAPWFVKNMVWTGNPVYPLAYEVFGGDDWSDENAAFYSGKAGEKGFRLDRTPVANGLNEGSEPRTSLEVMRDRGWNTGALEGVGGRATELALSPLTTSLFPRSFENHFLGAVPLIALVLALGGFVSSWTGQANGDRERRQGQDGSQERIARRGRVVRLWVLGVMLVSWTYWFLTYQSNRMLLPSLALLICLGTWGSAAMLARFGKTGRNVGAMMLYVLTILAVLYSLSFTGIMIWAGKKPAPLARAIGFGNRSDYLAEGINYYRSAQWLAHHASPENRALLIGEHRTLYFPGDIVSSDWFDTPQPLPLIRRTENNDELFALFDSEKIGYLVFNAEELRKYNVGYFRPRFTEAEYARFMALLADPRLTEVHRNPDHEIYIYEIERGQGLPPGEQSDSDGPTVAGLPAGAARGQAEPAKAI